MNLVECVMSRVLSLFVVLSALGCAKNAAKSTQNSTGGGSDDGSGEAQIEPLVFTMTAPASGAIRDADTVTAEGTWSLSLIHI